MFGICLVKRKKNYVIFTNMIHGFSLTGGKVG
jgi:hypothetical protein